jgi:hypothetical protein
MKLLSVALVALVAAIAAPAAQAQDQVQVRDSSQVRVETARDAGPRRANAVAGVQVSREDRVPADASAAVMQNAPTGQARLLMVVGAAAFVGGLLIGDDAGTAIAVVGLGVGIYGLYLYMR